MAEQDIIETAPIGDLQPYHRNTRKHPETQIAKLAKLLEIYGIVVPLIVDEENEVLAGNGTLIAAGRAGLTEVPIRRVVGWSEEKKARYCLLDNRLGELSEWDGEALAAELKKLTDSAMMFELGFSDEELDAYMSDTLSFVVGGDKSQSAVRTLTSKIGEESVPISASEFDAIVAARDKHATEHGSDEGFIDALVNRAPKID